MSAAFLTALALVMAAAGSACGGASPAAPSGGPISLTGRWSGSAADSSGPGQMTWEITQSGGSFSGTLTTVDARSGATGRGSVDGRVAGSSIQYSMTVPTGGFDDPWGDCTASVSGTAQGSSSSLTGTYSGTNSCSGPVTSGQIMLSRQ